MNEAELSTILYYADLLALKQSSTTVTDNCKYFFVHGVPMNISFIVNLQPFYDENSPYFQQSVKEYCMLKNKFGEEGVKSFMENICNLGLAGSVNAIQMLKYIHRYSDKEQRNRAFRQYKRFKNSIKYTTTTLDESGNEIEIECSKYIAHTERNSKRSKIYKSV